MAVFESPLNNAVRIPLVRRGCSAECFGEPFRAQDIIRRVNIGDVASDFELTDLGGRLHRLGDYRDRIVILNFWSSECPHSEATDRLLLAMQARWGDRVVLLPVACNANETTASISAVAGQRHLPLMLLDPEHRVADLFAAETTPHVFIVDAHGRLRYRGAINDTYFARRMPSRNYVEEVVEALLAGGQPPVSETAPYGCAINRHALE